MPEREKLTTLTFITDCDTSMYEIGEVDGCFSDLQLEYYLNMFGADKLLLHLAWLTAKVVEIDIKRRPTQQGYSDNG